MAKILVIFLLTLASQIACPAFAIETTENLPIYPPRINVINESGKPLSPRPQPILELKKITLKIEKNNNSETGYVFPQTISDADKMLRNILSPDLYERLMKNYKEISVNGFSEKDPALDERFGDLAIFFDRAWNLKKNDFLIKNYEKRYDYIERFEGLLDSLNDYNNKNQYLNKK